MLKTEKVFVPSFKPGSIVSNNQIVDEFKTGNMGGMRRSKSTNSLVLISDHTKVLYDDKWKGDVLHYTGMGKVGDQVLAGNQNKTLAESNSNGVTVHLFEVFNPKEYIYQGEVFLCEKPYQEEQKDENGILRKVYIFPVKPKAKTITIPLVTINSLLQKETKEAQNLSDEELEKRASARASKQTTMRNVVSSQYFRDPYIAQFAKRRANGICQLCNAPAPFKDKNNKPYLESHHIIWLAEGGEDSIENTVALCPNCHKKMHIVNDEKDKETLQRKGTIKA